MLLAPLPPKCMHTVTEPFPSSTVKDVCSRVGAKMNWNCSDCSLQKIATFQTMISLEPSSRRPKETPATAKLFCYVPTIIISTHTLPFHCLAQDSKVDGG